MALHYRRNDEGELCPQREETQPDLNLVVEVEVLDL